MGLGPLPPAANILRMAISGVKSGEPWANILNFKWSGSTPTVTSLTAIGNQVFSLWQLHVSSLQPADIVLSGIKITDMSSITGAQVELAGVQGGENGEDPIPNQVAVLIDYPVPLRYRGGHPRTYLVAGGDGDLSPGSGNWNMWNNSFLAAVATGWTAFINGVEAVSSGGTNVDQLTCVRYHHAGAYIIPPIQLGLDSFTVSAQVATQRRRTGRK